MHSLLGGVISRSGRKVKYSFLVRTIGSARYVLTRPKSPLVLCVLFDICSASSVAFLESLSWIVVESKFLAFFLLTLERGWWGSLG